MKKALMVIVVIMVTTVVLMLGCSNKPYPDWDYRQGMRDFVQNISVYAKSVKPGFMVIPQNGHELLTKNREMEGEYGYERDKI